MLGTYGDVTFEVSSERVRTWTDFKRQGKARWASHELVQEKPVLQFVGPDIEEITFSIRFDVSLGLNPRSELEKLRKLRDDGEPQTLTINGKGLGKYALESLAEEHRYHDNKGSILAAVVSVTLKEYFERNDDPKYRQGLTNVTSLADDAQELPWKVADAAKGITTVPDLVVGQVSARTNDAGGGFLSKLGKAASGIQNAATLAESGVQGVVSKAVSKLGLNVSDLSEVAGTSPASAVSKVVDRASSLGLGQARSALSNALGTDAATISEKYLGRSRELTDTARYANLDWLSGVDSSRALGDVSVSRAASLASKVADIPSKAAALARINI